LHQALNKQTNRYWGPTNTHAVIECKKVHGAKVMGWVGMPNGLNLPVVWFEDSVNCKIYLDHVLKGYSLACS
jgi:hypothetical protein